MEDEYMNLDTKLNALKQVKAALSEDLKQLQDQLLLIEEEKSELLKDQNTLTSELAETVINLETE